MRLMFRISKDSPVYYLTSVTKDRLPVFRKTPLADLCCKSFDEARRSGGFLILAYVVMTDHFHAIVYSELKPSKVLQYLNGISSRRVIDYLKTNGHEASLKKLQHEVKDRQYKYSLWDHHSNGKLIISEDVLIQKVNYLHQNPVRAGLVSDPMDYRWSSARWWARKPNEDEPLTVDMEKIQWRSKA
jgi:putative transposase